MESMSEKSGDEETFENKDKLSSDKNDDHGPDDSSKSVKKTPTDPDKVPKVKQVRKPRPKLDVTTICGPRGIEALPEVFENFKPKGRGHEFRDLNVMMSKLEHWAHRLYPQATFDDVIFRLETLGTKKPVQIALDRIRTAEIRPRNLTSSTNQNEANENNDAATIGRRESEHEHADFTKKPAITVNMDSMMDDTFSGSAEVRKFQVCEFPTLANSQFECFGGTQNSQTKKLTDEQLKRIEENRRRAMEIRQRKSMALLIKPVGENLEEKRDPSIQNTTDPHSIDAGSSEKIDKNPNSKDDKQTMDDEEILRFMGIE